MNRLSNIYKDVWLYFTTRTEIPVIVKSHRTVLHVEHDERLSDNKWKIRLHVERGGIYAIARDRYNNILPKVISHILNEFEDTYVQLSKKGWEDNGYYHILTNPDDPERIIKYKYQLDVDQYEVMHKHNLMSLKIGTNLKEKLFTSPFEELSDEEYTQIRKRLRRFIRNLYQNCLLSVVEKHRA